MQTVGCPRNDTRHEREDEHPDQFTHSVENVIIFAWDACTPLRGLAPSIRVTFVMLDSGYLLFGGYGYFWNILDTALATSCLFFSDLLSFKVP